VNAIWPTTLLNNSSLLVAATDPQHYPTTVEFPAGCYLAHTITQQQQFPGECYLATTLTNNSSFLVAATDPQHYPTTAVSW
jgi:hypothetical protein